MLKQIIILPEAYVEFHKTSDHDCWCEPCIEWENGIPIIIHNNLNGDEDTQWRVHEIYQDGGPFTLEHFSKS